MSKIIYIWLGVITAFICFLIYLQCNTAHNCAVNTEQIKGIEQKVEIIQFSIEHPKKDTIVISNQINLLKL